MRTTSLIFTICFFILASGSSFAVAPRDGGSSGGAAGQAQLMMQQLGAEKARLTSENARLKQKLKKLEAALEENEKKADQSQKKSQNLNHLLGKERVKVNELVVKFRETIENLRVTERERNELNAKVQYLSAEMNTCSGKNVELANLGYELLDHYENKGMFSAMIQGEPFTQVKRVQIENLVEDYQYKIEDAKYKLNTSDDKSASR